MFFSNNDKNDLRKFDTRSDESVFVCYSFSSKAYRDFSKRTLCIKESVHVIFDELEKLWDQYKAEFEELL